jgi:hypothetical protein
MIFFPGCDKLNFSQNNKQTTKKDSSTTLEINEKDVKYSDMTPQKPYQIKEDGLYVYADGPSKVNYHDNKNCFDYVQKNYKYIKVPSMADEVKEDKIEIWGCCLVEKSCTSDLGKPSLYELGYERHKEREIKPEDNRFGVPVEVERTWHQFEKKVVDEYRIKYIEKDNFTKMTKKEFVQNGIVIIGKQISRVVIKIPVPLPFKYKIDRIPVGYTKIHYGCCGKHDETVYSPYTIADFKRINLKENIFEFIEEDPLPKDAAYLSDEQFIKLSEDIHQFIPRKNDKTIHPKEFNSFNAGYYIIEYYNGDQLYDYHCIQIDGKGRPPKYWDPLEFNPPVKQEISFANEKYALIFSECKSIEEAEHFIRVKDSYPLIILPNSTQGDYLVGRIFYSKKAAENEMKRVVNMGFKKEKIRIEKIK